jgi:hypothetical protein
MAANSMGAEQLIKLGAAGQQLGNTFNDIEVAHQIIDNENKTKSTVAGLISEYNAVVHGTPDADGNPAPDAYLTKSGQGAVDSYDVTQKKLRELKQKALDNMDNEAQRQLARPILDQQYEAFATKVAEHKDQQFKVAGLTSSTTLIAAKADSAPTSLNVITDKKLPVADLASPEANTPYQHDLRTVINEANHIVDLQNGVNFGRNGGDDAVVRTQLVKSQLEKVYVSVIGHLYASGKAGDGSTQIAKGYFDQVKGELSPAVRDDIEGKLNHATAADNLVTAQLALSGKGGFQAQRDALTEAFKGKDGDVKIGGVRVDGEMYKHLQSDIDHREDKAQQQTDRYKAQALGDGQRWVLEQQKKGGVVDVLQMPKALLTANQAGGHLASLSSLAARDDTKPTSPDAMFHVLNNFGSGNEQDITKVSDAKWLAMRPDFNERDFQRFTKERASQINGDFSASNDPGSVKTAGFVSTLNAKLEGVGLDIKKEGQSESGRARIAAAQQYARDYVIQQQQIAGKRFNDEDTSRALNQLFMKDVEFKGTLWGTNSRKVMATKINDIPSAERKGITTVLKETGNKNPTETDILTQYWKQHGR